MTDLLIEIGKLDFAGRWPRFDSPSTLLRLSFDSAQDRLLRTGCSGQAAQGKLYKSQFAGALWDSLGHLCFRLEQAVASIIPRQAQDRLVRTGWSGQVKAPEGD